MRTAWQKEGSDRNAAAKHGTGTVTAWSASARLRTFSETTARGPVGWMARLTEKNARSRPVTRRRVAAKFGTVLRCASQSVTDPGGCHAGALMRVDDCAPPSWSRDA